MVSRGGDILRVRLRQARLPGRLCEDLQLLRLDQRGHRQLQHRPEIGDHARGIS